MRLQVTPREAQVFVDGYFAGTVDEFDGTFQRLRIHPGGHELTVYLEGYETVRQTLYVSPGSGRTLRFSLSRLPPGVRSEAPPQPAPVDDDDDSGRPERGPRRPVPAEPDESPAPTEPEAIGRVGKLSLRVQPADAQIYIDGERWIPAAGDDRIVVEVPEGRHHVEVHRDRHSPYVEDVLIRRGATLTLNVTLARLE